jgi:hypothetical protein
VRLPLLDRPNESLLVWTTTPVASPLPLFLVLGWGGYELWSGKALRNNLTLGPIAAQPA